MQHQNVVDFNAGFSWWQVKWQSPCFVRPQPTNGHLHSRALLSSLSSSMSSPPSPPKVKVTADFECTIIARHAHGTAKSNFLWSISIDDEEKGETDDSEPSGRWIGLSRQSVSSKPTPIFYRVVLRDSDAGVILYNVAKMFQFDQQKSSIAWIRLDEKEGKLLNEERVALHVFLAIPLDCAGGPVILDAGSANHRGCFGGVPLQSSSSSHHNQTSLLNAYSNLLKIVFYDESDDHHKDDQKQVQGKGGKCVQDEDEVEEEDELEESDVTIVVDRNVGGGTRRFNCHRTILSAQSTYFRRIFARSRRRRNTASRRFSISTVVDEKAMAGFLVVQVEESATVAAAIETPTIEIEDVGETEMITVLQYVYSGELPLLLDDTGNGEEHEAALNLTKAALKFDLPDLRDHCVDALIFRFTDDKDRVEQLRVIGEQMGYTRDLVPICKQQLANYLYCTGGGQQEQEQWPGKSLSEETREEIFKMARDQSFSIDQSVLMKLDPNDDDNLIKLY